MLKQILKTEIKGITEETLTEFADKWIVFKNLKRHDFLYPQGKVEQNIYFVIDGSLKICYDINDKQCVVGFGYTNTFLFDLPSFFTGLPSDFYIQAIKASKLIGIDKKSFYEILDKNITIARYWRTRTEQIMLDLVEREIDILTKVPEERFLRLYKRNPELFQQIPNAHIASYLRMSPETLSRIKKS